MPDDVISYCPFEVNRDDWRVTNLPAAEAACLSRVPVDAEILPLELPRAVEETQILPSGVRMTVLYSMFPDEGLPRLVGMCHVRWRKMLVS